jgi:hypothetical protein
MKDRGYIDGSSYNSIISGCKELIELLTASIIISKKTLQKK